MQRAFFRVAEDGVLVYDDAFVGRLHHSASQLMVQWNRPLARLDLLQRGVLLEGFALEPDPEHACQQACGAYWQALDRWFRAADAQRAAA
jgi:hypothetical protein